jgi:hypothetical protein
MADNESKSSPNSAPELAAAVSTGQSASESGLLLTQPAATLPPSGRRPAFREIKRQLSEEDLSSPGVQKLLLDDLERAETECEILQGYIERYHEADKRSAVFEERIRSVTAIDIMFGVGVGLGGTIMGLSPTFWADQPKGLIVLIIGGLLVVGASIARVVKR